MKRTAFCALALVTALFLAAGNAAAAGIEGVQMEETIAVGGRTLTLAGLGIRTKTFLKIKVYAAGLYMEDPVLDAKTIIGTDQPRAMVMTFLYKEVDDGKLRESWVEGFESNTPAAGADLKKRMELFVSLFTEPAVKGDTYIFAYEPEKGTVITLKGETKATIPGADFASSLMAIWFGETLADGGLRNLKKSILKGM